MSTGACVVETSLKSMSEAVTLSLSKCHLLLLFKPEIIMKRFLHKVEMEKHKPCRLRKQKKLPKPDSFFTFRGI